MHKATARMPTPARSDTAVVNEFRGGGSGRAGHGGFSDGCIAEHGVVADAPAFTDDRRNVAQLPRPPPLPLPPPLPRPTSPSPSPSSGASSSSTASSPSTPRRRPASSTPSAPTSWTSTSPTSSRPINHAAATPAGSAPADSPAFPCPRPAADFILGDAATRPSGFRLTPTDLPLHWARGLGAPGFFYGHVRNSLAVAQASRLCRAAPAFLHRRDACATDDPSPSVRYGGRDARPTPRQIHRTTRTGPQTGARAVVFGLIWASERDEESSHDGRAGSSRGAERSDKWLSLAAGGRSS